MIQPRRDEFEGGMLIASYRTVAPVTLQVRGSPEPQSFAAGAVVNAVGYPAAALMPINHEAAYAKVHAIRREVRQHGWLPSATLTAISLGSPVLSHIDATQWVRGVDKKPQTRFRRTVMTFDFQSAAQITKFIRPRVSAGDGTTSITVTLLARRS
jgi:hypothetical protein